MANQQASFIPKQPGSASPGIGGRSPRRVAQLSIVNFVGMVVFLCGLILAVGVFIYKDLSVQDLETKKRALNEQKSSFSAADISALRALDRRIGVASALLDAHLVPSKIFDMLESRTLSGVQFDVFSYHRRPSGAVEVVLQGLSGRFNTVALQDREFRQAAALSDVALTNLSISDDGLVSFVVVGEVDERALVYVAPLIEAATTTAVSATTTATTTGEVSGPTPTDSSPVAEDVVATTTPEEGVASPADNQEPQ